MTPDSYMTIPVADNIEPSNGVTTTDNQRGEINIQTENSGGIEARPEFAYSTTIAMSVPRTTEGGAEKRIVVEEYSAEIDRVLGLSDRCNLSRCVRRAASRETQRTENRSQAEDVVWVTDTIAPSDTWIKRGVPCFLPPKAH